MSLPFLIQKCSPIKVDDIIFDLVDDALTTVINDALHKCSIQQIVDGTCEFKDLNDFSFNQPKPKLIM